MIPVLKLQESDVLLPTVFKSPNVFDAHVECDSWPEEIENLIIRCWDHDTDRRPSFDEIYEFWNFHRDRLLKHRFQDSGAWWFKAPTSPDITLPARSPPITPSPSSPRNKIDPLVLSAAKRSADRLWMDNSLSL